MAADTNNTCTRLEELYTDALFSDFIENGRTAGEKVKKAYNEYMTALDNYIAAMQEEIFKEAYIYIKGHDAVIKKA